eukprot:scaffold54371_cov51-Cyclotella_meneghiniana.AAC.4
MTPPSVISAHRLLGEQVVRCWAGTEVYCDGYDADVEIPTHHAYSITDDGGDSYSLREPKRCWPIYWRHLEHCDLSAPHWSRLILILQITCTSPLNKPTTVESKVDSVQDAVESKIDAVESKVDVVQDAVESKVDAVESKVDAVKSKVDAVQDELSELKVMMTNLMGMIANQ